MKKDITIVESITLALGGGRTQEPGKVRIGRPYSISRTAAFPSKKTDESIDYLKNIFEGLQNCSGLISFLHERDLVTTEDKGEWGYQSSVWVNQEIGILAYRKQFEGVEIPIMVFKDKKVRL